MCTNSVLRYVVCCVVFVLMSSTCVNAQRFAASAFVGLTMAQMQGDNLAGFEKAGVSTGVKVGYTFTDRVSLALELNYNQRGSKDGLFKSDSLINKTALQYFSLPLILEVKDWYIDAEDYYRISGHVGVDYSLLFNAESGHVFFEGIEDRFRNNDIGLMFGASYYINRNLSATARYHRSLTKLYKDPSLITGGLLSYFWTLRVDYNF